MKTWTALLYAGMSVYPSFFAWSQIPVKLVNQPNLRFEEDFDSLRSWQDGFTSGAGAEHWSPVGIHAGGTIPDGVTTTISTDTFAKPYLTPGVHKSPSTTSETYLELLTSGSQDNSAALAIDFWVDFAHILPGRLALDVSAIHNGNPGSNRRAMLQVYYSTDTQTFHLIPDLQFEAINYQDTTVRISTVLPDSLADHIVIFRFYSFNSPGGSTGSRPRIGIDNLVVEAHEENMPLRLVSFTAEVIKSAVALHWTTDSEQNTSHFVVERSNDGFHFQAIAQIPAAGHSDLPRSYDFTDYPEAAKNLFYRLQMVDLDGRFAYSPVVRVIFRAQYLKRIYPNPAGGWLYVEWNMPAENRIECRLLDLAGRMVWSGQLHAGESRLEIPLQAMPAGFYYLWIQEWKTPAYAFPVLHL
ncbi:MAG: T9SS type A sorting domain-containing protein [Thermoflavifilum aggregans]|nr:T9SS type A sorting domain-containing protein [Thermoflavifilum aggregans]